MRLGPPVCRLYARGMLIEAIYIPRFRGSAAEPDPWAIGLHSDMRGVMGNAMRAQARVDAAFCWCGWRNCVYACTSEIDFNHPFFLSLRNASILWIAEFGFWQIDVERADVHYDRVGDNGH